VVPEGHQVLRDLSVEDNLLAAGTSLSAQALAQSVDEALTLFPELKARLTTQAGNLSGGQKQMVSISQALISRPKFLLIDELSLGLAPTVVQRLVEALKLISSRGVGILLVEQFTQLALAVSSRAYVLQLGKIVFKGESATLLDHPSLLHDAYLGS
jgi:branched-chain amino acid transport system ATP-binding protein